MTPDTEARRVSKFSQHFEVKVNFPEIIDFRFRRMSSLKRGITELHVYLADTIDPGKIT